MYMIILSRNICIIYSKCIEIKNKIKMNYYQEIYGKRKVRQKYMKLNQSDHEDNTFPRMYSKYFPRSTSQPLLINNHQLSRTKALNNVFLNQETLPFQSENENGLKAFRDYITSRSNNIEANTERYLSFIAKSNNSRSPPSPQRISFTISKPFVPGIVKTKHSDINNPYYYNKMEESYMDFVKRREKDYLLYNKDMGYNKPKKTLEMNINPFNRRSLDNLGTSKLNHNPILNPVDNYRYNPFLSRKKVEDSVKGLIFDK